MVIKQYFPAPLAGTIRLPLKQAVTIQLFHQVKGSHVQVHQLRVSNPDFAGPKILQGRQYYNIKLRNTMYVYVGKKRKTRKKEHCF